MSSSNASAGANTSAAQETGGPPPKSVRWALLGVMLAMLLSVLDNTVVGTAMTTIVGDLGGIDQLAWVVSAYTLATAVTTPVWGKFGDLFGRKWVYLISVVVFLVGSALSGAAQDMTELIAFRILQGVGAGGIGAGAFALIGALVPPRYRGSYQGMAAAVMAIGTVGGPLIGGIVTGVFGWRWIFYMNIPLGIIALVWCWFLLKVPHQKRAVTIDWLGIGLLGILITSLVLGAGWAGTTYPWASWQIIGCGAIALVCLVAFIAWERRAAEPLLPLSLFSNRNFRITTVLLFACGAAMFGATLYLPTFQQTVQGITATSSGLLLLPLMGGNLIVAQIAGTVMSRTGRYKIFPILGTLLLTISFALFATMGVDTPFWLTCAYMVIASAGLGCLLQMSTTIAQNSVEVRNLGAASAAITLFRTLGGSIGVAVFGSIFIAAVTRTAGTSTAGSAYISGIATGTSQLFLVGAVACAIAFVFAWFITEEPLKG